MTDGEESRMHILRMIEDGKITADEGLRLLNAMGGPEATARDEALPGDTAPQVDYVPPVASGETQGGARTTAGPAPRAKYWRGWWRIPMFIGVGIILLGGLAMYGAYQSSGFGFWFACAWLPFLFGVAVAALAWNSRKARWVHIRIDNSEGERPRRIAISLPIPLGWLGWLAHIFRNRLPNTAVDELITALNDSTTPDAPVYIEVNEGEKGERVQVYIG